MSNKIEIPHTGIATIVPSTNDKESDYTRLSSTYKIYMAKKDSEETKYFIAFRDGEHTIVLNLKENDDKTRKDG